MSLLAGVEGDSRVQVSSSRLGTTSYRKYTELRMVSKVLENTGEVSSRPIELTVSVDVSRIH